MILVTGATGHIGNVLVRELLTRGERVRALVRRPGHPALAGLAMEQAAGDVLDADSLRRALRGVERVFHLAARISLQPGPDPVTEEINHAGTLNLLSAMRAEQVDRLVFASSIYALRPASAGTVLDESSPFDPASARGAYDRSKALASLAVQQAAREGLNAVLACPTAVVGPYDFHGSEAGRAIRLYLRWPVQFTIDGAYDFVDVRDVARGLIQAAERGTRGGTYILGGERLTIAGMARAARQAAGKPCFALPIPDPLADLGAELVNAYAQIARVDAPFTSYSLEAVRSNSLISHEKAVRELGYHPRPGREALADAVAWYVERDPSLAARSWLAWMPS
jgi:dihydroflavonol-4-reductase